jgi:hypothetical protein
LSNAIFQFYSLFGPILSIKLCFYFQSHIISILFTILSLFYFLKKVLKYVKSKLYSIKPCFHFLSPKSQYQYHILLQLTLIVVYHFLWVISLTFETFIELKLLDVHISGHYKLMSTKLVLIDSYTAITNQIIVIIWDKHLPWIDVKWRTCLCCKTINLYSRDLWSKNNNDMLTKWFRL